jgi:hypothetical protein
MSVRPLSEPALGLNDAATFRVMLRTAQSLPHQGFDTGRRPRGYSHAAASLLPDLLAATRTGLTPASDELTTTDHLHKITSGLLGA